MREFKKKNKMKNTYHVTSFNEEISYYIVIEEYDIKCDDDDDLNC